MQLLVLVFICICFGVNGMNDRLLTVINSAQDTIKVILEENATFYANINVGYKTETCNGVELYGLTWDRDKTTPIKEFDVNIQKFKMGYLKNYESGDNTLDKLSFYKGNTLIGSFFVGESPLSSSFEKDQEKIEFYVNEREDIVLRHIWWISNSGVIIKILQYNPDCNYLNNKAVNRHKGPIGEEDSENSANIPHEYGYDLDGILKFFSPEDPPSSQETLSTPEGGCCQIS